MLTPSLTPLLSSLLAMAGFALVGAITPGPVNVMALRHGQHSAAAAMVYVLGASTSYAAIVWCMGQGAQQLLLKMPAFAAAAQWLCAAYLLRLAWLLAKSPVKEAGHEQSPPKQSAWQLFSQGAAIQLLNPKAWLFALSAVGVFTLPQSEPIPGALYALCLISLFACLLGVGFWAVLGKALSRWLCNARRQHGFHQLLAALLLASVAGMMLPS
ncbi:LysE family translocator [Comamonas sp.]|uniref:LysE family translocator n=1 Tax=Comamonas sp. TaxID=34028 RepID=UPI003A93BB62